MLTVPFIVIGILFAVPFISNTGEKSPRRRPVAVLERGRYIHSAGCLQLSGHLRAVVAKNGCVDQRGHARELSGRAFAAGTARCPGFPYQAMHQLPQRWRQRRFAWTALDDVATRLTGDQLVRQVIQGSGNMPAYGKNLSPAEVAATSRIHAYAALGRAKSPARDTTQPQQAAIEVARPKTFAKAEQARR